MASIAELLANFKTLMHQWFPFTTEMNSAINTVDARIDDVAEEIYMKTGCTNQLRDTVDIVDLETEVQNMLVNIGLTYEGWLSDNGVEECIVSVGQSLGYDDDTVFIVLDHFYFYDSSEEKVSLINDYDVQLEASSYNVDIGESVTLTATLTDKIGNPIPYKIVHLYKDGSLLNQGITNANGVASFTYTCNSEGLQTLYVGNAHVSVNVKYDTGWENVDTYSSIKPFEGVSGRSLKARRIGDIVNIQGVLQHTNSNPLGGSTGEVTISSSLPTKFRPLLGHRSLQQCGGSKIYLLTVTTDGKLTISRARDGNNYSGITNTEYINIFVTYMVD